MKTDYDPENRTLKTFAAAHRLRVPKDECGDLNVVGKRGDIYEHHPGVLAVTILRCPTAEYWNSYRPRFQKAGSAITQNGDTEGTALIDPENPEQVELALQAIQTGRKRVLSPEHREKLKQAGSKSRFQGQRMKSEKPDES